MKIFTLICIVCGQAVCGCGNASSEKQILEIQSRLDRLEVRLDKINANNASNFDNLLSLDQDAARIAERMHTNEESLDRRMDLLAMSGKLQAALYSNFMDRLDALERGRPTNRVAMPIRTVPQPLRYGIPSDVYDGIAADAAKRFPGDYDEQVYIINEQVTAYKKLHP